ncbi:metallophosphoesterase [Jatrophihabitans sp. YIM 134969]
MCNDHPCDRPALDHAGRPFSTGRPATSRRAFLRTGGLIGAGAAVATGLGLPSATSAAAAPAPAPAATWKPDTTSPRFTLAVMPDTQYLFDGAAIHPGPLQASLQWLLDHQAEHNIVFLAHLGDLTQNGQPAEFAAIGKAFSVLDKAHVAYSVLAGNHDIDGSRYDDQRGSSAYLSTFGPARFAGSPSYRGSTPDGYNSYHVFRAGGRQWLLFALDWRTSDANLAWVERILARFPTAAAIVTTHDIVGAYDDGSAGFDEYGQHLWDQLISRHDQVFLTLNGHYWPPARTTMQNAAGHDVHLHLANYQNRYYGGAAMLRLYHVDLERDTIDVETVSPWVLGQDPTERNELEAQ